MIANYSASQMRSKSDLRGRKKPFRTARFERALDLSGPTLPVAGQSYTVAGIAGAGPGGGADPAGDGADTTVAEHNVHAAHMWVHGVDVRLIWLWKSCERIRGGGKVIGSDDAALRYIAIRAAPIGVILKQRAGIVAGGPDAFLIADYVDVAGRNAVAPRVIRDGRGI